MTSPTLAWTGCGANLKSLIVTFTVAVEPVGAVAQAAPAAPPDAAAGDPAAGDPAAGDPAAGTGAGELDAGVDAVPEHAASVRTATSVGNRVRRRMRSSIGGDRRSWDCRSGGQMLHRTRARG